MRNFRAFVSWASASLSVAAWPSGRSNSSRRPRSRGLLLLAARASVRGQLLPAKANEVFLIAPNVIGCILNALITLPSKGVTSLG